MAMILTQDILIFNTFQIYLKLSEFDFIKKYALKKPEKVHKFTTKISFIESNKKIRKMVNLKKNLTICFLLTKSQNYCSHWLCLNDLNICLISHK